MDAYSNFPKLKGMKNITTEKVMETRDTFQGRFGKWDEFGWWDMNRVQTDSGT